MISETVSSTFLSLSLILYGKEAVASGLIDKLGGLNDALSALHKMIRRSGKSGKGSKEGDQ